MEKGETPNDIISQQNERIQEYIKQRKWKLVKKYSDRKKEEFEETAYLQMKQDAMGRQFDCLVIPVGIPYMFIIVPTRWSLSGTVGMAAFCVIIGALFGVVLAAVIVVRAVWYVTMFPLSCLVRHREGRNGI